MAPESLPWSTRKWSAPFTEARISSSRATPSSAEQAPSHLVCFIPLNFSNPCCLYSDSA